MIRSTMTRGLLVGGALLLASTASAQAPNPNAQGKSPSVEPVKTAPAKPDDKAKALDGKTAKADDKGADRAARKAKEHEAQKTELNAKLKGPADDALKEELRRHAERVARLERIKSVATDAKDADSGARATKLLAKENGRHDQWMTKRASATPTTPATPTTAPAAVPTTKEGAK
jgi:hypothetical protein